MLTIYNFNKCLEIKFQFSELIQIIRIKHTILTCIARNAMTILLENPPIFLLQNESLLLFTL